MTGNSLPAGARPLSASMFQPRAELPLTSRPQTHKFAQQAIAAVTAAATELGTFPVRLSVESIVEQDQDMASPDGICRHMRFSASGQTLRLFIACDRSFAFAMTDLALGGTGEAPPSVPEDRPLSAIETEVGNFCIARIASALLPAISANFSLAELREAEDPGAVQESEASGSYLTFRLLLNVFAYDGELQIGLHRDDLLKAAADAAQSAPAAANSSLQQAVGACPAVIQFTFPPDFLTVGEVAQFRAGQILNLGCTVRSITSGAIGGVQVCSGHLARAGDRIAVRLS